MAINATIDRALMFLCKQFAVHTYILYIHISKYVIFYNKRLLLLRNLFVFDLTPRHNFTLLQNVLHIQQSVLYIHVYMYILHTYITICTHSHIPTQQVLKVSEQLSCLRKHPTNNIKQKQKQCKYIYKNQFLNASHSLKLTSERKQ